MRTPEITTALEYVHNGVEGSCLVDYKHKATISWTLDTLAGEVERLEAHLKGAMQDGGYEHFTAQLRNAQKQAHNAIYVAQQLEKKVAELEAQNARLREALEHIEKARPVLYDMNTLLRFAGIAGDIAKAALADGKAAPS